MTLERTNTEIVRVCSFDLSACVLVIDVCVPMCFMYVFVVGVAVSKDESVTTKLIIQILDFCIVFIN